MGAKHVGNIVSTMQILQAGLRVHNRAHHLTELLQNVLAGSKPVGGLAYHVQGCMMQEMHAKDFILGIEEVLLQVHLGCNALRSACPL